MVALNVRRKTVAGASEPQARLMGQGADPSCPQRREIPQNLPISPSLENFASPNTPKERHRTTSSRWYVATVNPKPSFISNSITARDAMLALLSSSAPVDRLHDDSLSGRKWDEFLCVVMMLLEGDYSRHHRQSAPIPRRPADYSNSLRP